MPLTPTPPGTPTGVKPEDGFKTLLTCSLNPTIQFWEVGVKPPGVDGGDAIDTSTMHNNVWRTRASRKLLTLSDATATVTYDPAIYNAILTIINKNTAWTATFWDRSSLTFYAALRNFDPAEITEGTQPRATITLSPTNQDPVTGAESAPVYTAPPVGGSAPMAPVAPELRPSGAPPDVPEGVDFASTYEQPAPPAAPAPEPQLVTQEAR
jgi:hypothetical protein